MNGCHNLGVLYRGGKGAGGAPGMKIAVGSDHAGFGLKQHVATLLEKGGHEMVDAGTHSTEPVDYPDFAEVLGQAVLEGRAERGVLVLGGRIVGPALVPEPVRAFVGAQVTSEERHLRRLDKVKAIERRYTQA